MASSTIRTCGKDQNSVSFSNSSQRRPLKLSLWLFCCGLLGAMELDSKLASSAHLGMEGGGPAGRG
jgi:hypothetical protein